MFGILKVFESVDGFHPLKLSYDKPIKNKSISLTISKSGLLGISIINSCEIP